jgi:hypothetical protein
LIEGNPARAVETFGAIPAIGPGARRSLLEEAGGSNLRLTTRRIRSLYDPVSDEKLLKRALHLRDFHLAVQEDDRFRQFFDPTTPWPER